MRPQSSILCMTVAALIGIGASLLWTPVDADELPPQHPRRLNHGTAMDRLINATPHIPTGNETEARDYYKTIVADQMKFLSAATPEQSSIKDILTYFGYPNLAARDLHLLPSDALMALSDPDDILATRFFAPKISRVETPPVASPKGGYGWRKLVRFKARPGSDADTNGMSHFYFLQNIFEPTATGNPFAVKNLSLFNQGIAIRKAGSGPYNLAKRAAYFFAYDPLAKCAVSGTVVECEPGTPLLQIGGQLQDNGKLGLKLKATFDARNPEIEAKGKDLYYVPRSCTECHGRSEANAKLNMLDTDHWHDRVTPIYGLADQKFSQEDFTGLSGSEHPVLYDRKIDKAMAFTVIRKLNEEIRQQNGDTNSTFQLAAVTKWLQLHEAGGPDPTRHVPPYERGFGTQSWEANNNDQRTILYYLNRYCYRCHSSIKYNVFDRAAVKENISDGDIVDRVKDTLAPPRWMPQDRMFPGLELQGGVPQETGDLKQFLDLLRNLP